jgi:hypothetical protein
MKSRWYQPGYDRHIWIAEGLPTIRLMPSGQYFAWVNREWRGFDTLEEAQAVLEAVYALEGKL